MRFRGWLVIVVIVVIVVIAVFFGDRAEVGALVAVLVDLDTALKAPISLRCSHRNAAPS